MSDAWFPRALLYVVHSSQTPIMLGYWFLCFSVFPIHFASFFYHSTYLISALLFTEHVQPCSPFFSYFTMKTPVSLSQITRSSYPMFRAKFRHPHFTSNTRVFVYLSLSHYRFSYIRSIVVRIFVLSSFVSLPRTLVASRIYRRSVLA